MVLFIILSLFSQADTTKRDTLYFESDRMEYNRKEGKIFLFGNAEMKFKNILLKADTVEFRRNENLLIAYGNPVLYSGKDSLRGKLLKYHIKTQKGYAFKGSSQIEKGFVWGDRIYRTDDKTVKGFDSFFTTCDLDPPHYYFTSPRMKVTLQDMAVASPVRMDIKEIPVLWAPFWMFPVKKGRKSGFMTPHPGRSSGQGLYIRNLSYYWAINNYMDAMFTLDLFEHQGPRFGIDFIYILYRQFSGNLKGTYVRELTTRRERWNINGAHKQNLPLGFKMNARADFMSDKSYALDYSEYQVGRFKSETYSYISLARGWKIASFQGNADYRRDFVNKKTTMTLPNLFLTFFGKNLGPLRLSGGSSWTRKIVEDTLSKTRQWVWGNSGGVGFQKKIGVLMLSSSSKMGYAIYDRDTLGNYYPKVKTLQLSSNLSTKVYGLSWFGVYPFERFLHTLSPVIGFSYTPYVENPPVKGINTTQARSGNITFSLNNYWTGKIKKGEKIQKMTLLSMNFTSSYNLLEEEKSKRLSPILASASVLPLNGRFSALFYPEEKKWKDFKMGLSYKGSLTFIPQILFGQELKDTTVEEDTLKQEEEKTEVKPWGISLDFTYKNVTGTGVSSQLNMGLSGSITPKWTFSYSLGYDPDLKQIVSQRLSVIRDLHCFRAQINWDKNGKNWNYQFRVWITALPDMEIKRGFFETILPSIQE